MEGVCMMRCCVLGEKKQKNRSNQNNNDEQGAIKAKINVFDI